MANPILTAALKNEDEVTHVVTHIEYGSELFIELQYECKLIYFRISFFNLQNDNFTFKTINQQDLIIRLNLITLVFVR